jgi:hypothetical protein
MRPGYREQEKDGAVALQQNPVSLGGVSCTHLKCRNRSDSESFGHTQTRSMHTLGSTRDPSKPFPRAGAQLTLDGVALHRTRLRSVSPSGDGPYRLSVFDPKSAAALWDVPLEQIREMADTLHVTLPAPIGDFFGALVFDFLGDASEEHPGPKITATPTTRLDQWARPYSAAELAVAIERELSSRGLDHCKFLEGDDFPTGSPDFALLFSLQEPLGTLATNFASIAPPLEDLLNTATKELLALARRNSIVTFFEFPSSVRTACQQYLVYFVQFLSDLGIEADAELKEDAQRVLFSVTPRDGADALDRIRTALGAYLSLPESDAVHTGIVHNGDIAMLQLDANVMHLKSQLALANAVQQAQGATIESLQLSNFQYRQLLLTQQPTPPTELKGLIPSSSEMTSGADEVQANDDEEFFDGTIAVSKLKLRNVTIDVPRILRGLTRRIRGQSPT